MQNAMCACMASYSISIQVHRHTHHKQKVVFLLGAAQFWSKFLNIFFEETAKFTVRLQKETDHAFSELSANSIFSSLTYIFLCFRIETTVVFLSTTWTFVVRLFSGWKMLSVNIHP